VLANAVGIYLIHNSHYVRCIELHAKRMFSVARDNEICGYRTAQPSQRDEVAIAHLEGERLLDGAILRRMTSQKKVPAARYRGKFVVPIKNLSIACAQSLPSRMAQTTSDWPRRMSPAEKTLGREVW